MTHSKRSPADKADDRKLDPFFESIRHEVDGIVDSIERKNFTAAQLLEIFHQPWADIHNDLSVKLSEIPVETRKEYSKLESIVQDYLEYLEVHYESMTEEIHRLTSILKPTHQTASSPPSAAVGGTKELMDSLRLVIYHAREATESLNELVDKIEIEERECLERQRENTKPFLTAATRMMEFSKAAESESA